MWSSQVSLSAFSKSLKSRVFISGNAIKGKYRQMITGNQYIGRALIHTPAPYIELQPFVINCYIDRQKDNLQLF